MDRHQYLVNEYELILALSEQMLALAEAGKWDELVGLEVSYLKAVEATTKLPLSETISATTNYQIRKSLQSILKNETQIKSLLKGRLDSLSELIGQNMKRQEVNAVYSRF